MDRAQCVSAGVARGRFGCFPVVGVIDGDAAIVKLEIGDEAGVETEALGVLDQGFGSKILCAQAAENRVD